MKNKNQFLFIVSKISCYPSSVYLISFYSDMFPVTEMLFALPMSVKSSFIFKTRFLLLNMSTSNS